MERGQENTEFLKLNSCDLVIGCELTLSKHEVWGLQEVTLFHINLLFINECIREKKRSWSDQSPRHPKISRQGAFVKTHPTDSLGFLLLKVLLVSWMFHTDWFYHANVEAMFMIFVELFNPDHIHQNENELPSDPQFIQQTITHPAVTVNLSLLTQYHWLWGNHTLMEETNAPLQHFPYDEKQRLFQLLWEHKEMRSFFFFKKKRLYLS